MRIRALAFLVSTVLASSVSAQGLMPDMHRDVNDVQKKFIDLAQAIPESAYAWRPTGARSIGEVLLHVASDNYFIPIYMGKPAPAATNLVATDFKTLETFEKRKLTKAQIVSELEASFKHLHEHLGQLIAYARSNNIAPPWSR